MESCGYVLTLTGDQLKQETEEDKVRWIILNTLMNDPCATGSEEEYDSYAESLMWARSEEYFPRMEEQDLLSLLRKYDMWNAWEESFQCKEN